MYQTEENIRKAYLTDHDAFEEKHHGKDVRTTPRRLKRCPRCRLYHHHNNKNRGQNPDRLQHHGGWCNHTTHGRCTTTFTVCMGRQPDRSYRGTSIQHQFAPSFFTRESCRLDLQGWSAKETMEKNKNHATVVVSHQELCMSVVDIALPSSEALTLQSMANRRASMIMVFRSLAVSKARARLRSLRGRQNIACEAASPPPRTPHNWNRTVMLWEADYC